MTNRATVYVVRWNIVYMWSRLKRRRRRRKLQIWTPTSETNWIPASKTRFLLKTIVLCKVLATAIYSRDGRCWGTYGKASPPSPLDSISAPNVKVRVNPIPSRTEKTKTFLSSRVRFIFEPKHKFHQIIIILRSLVATDSFLTRGKKERKKSLSLSLFHARKWTISLSLSLSCARTHTHTVQGPLTLINSTITHALLRCTLSLFLSLHRGAASSVAFFYSLGNLNFSLSHSLSDSLSP